MAKELYELESKSIFVLIGKIVGQILPFISVIVAGRVLSAVIYGETVYIISLLAIFMIFPRFGMEKGLISYVPRNSITLDEKKSTVTFSLTIVTIISVLFIFTIFVFRDVFFYYILNSSYRELFFIMVPMIFLESFKAILRSTLRGARQIKDITFKRVLPNSRYGYKIMARS
jgi:O-antigen/teichoic acid export membrane protein